MPDTEQVMNALRCLSNPFDEERDCDNCPYDFCSCVFDVTADALELLKEQEPVKPVNVHMYSKMYANVKSGYCPICNHEVDEEEDNNFCSKCGRRLNWDV